MRAAIFLDRDHTLIENDGDLGDPNLVKLVRGAASAVASLRGLGYRIVVVTNQGGVARDRFTEQDVHAVHERVNQLIRATAGVWIDRFYYCPYHPDAVLEQYRKDHSWRKPRPGMELQASRDMGLDLTRSWTIGDQIRDIEAGLAAGTRTILIDPDVDGWAPTNPDASPVQPHGESGSASAVPHFVARDLIDAAKVVAQHRSPELKVEPRRAGADMARADARRRGAPSETVEPRQEPPPPLSPANTVASSIAAPSSSATETEASPQSTAPAVESSPTAPADTGSARYMLRQILQELRHRRSRDQQLTPITMFAIVLQVIALVCLLAAFWLSAGNPEDFMRWLGCGILIQLATIAALLFQNRV